MNFLHLSDCIINVDAILYINIYPVGHCCREKLTWQVCFAGNDNFVNVDNAFDIEKLKAVTRPR